MTECILREGLFINNKMGQKDRTEYLNDCAIKTLNRINKEVELEGIEKRIFRINRLKFQVSEYTAKQEAAQAREARRRENDVYNVFI